MLKSKGDIMDEILVGDIYTLTDDESGEEKDYEVIGVADIDDNSYVALVLAEEDAEEYMILKVDMDGDERILVTVDDDDEWEKVAEYFDNELFSDIDYDEDGE
ncbi:MAG: DUF1292 domain-containing protein [Ruminococcaceae bacterium]|nr:DUF1292 domain-containing protein [Oscillospiraceae bacterium]